MFFDYDIMTDDYNDSLSKNSSCTDKEKNTDIFIQTIIITIPCVI